MIDYKIVRKVENRDGTQTVVIRVYEGEWGKETDKGVERDAYIRSRIVGEKELTFTRILTDEEIVKVCNKELETVAVREKKPTLDVQKDTDSRIEAGVITVKRDTTTAIKR